MTQKHEWLTAGMTLERSREMLAGYEREGWQLVSLSWDSEGGCFMGCWKRPLPAVNAVELRETVSRLRSWIRDYGEQKQPYFIADLETVLDAVVKAE